MNCCWRFIKEHKYETAVFLIILLAFVLRFYNYTNRWGLAYDQARDVIVAKEALEEHKIPLIGPFASAGQFVYGPQWFWILMPMISVYPNAVITPWIIQTTLYVGAVLMMIIMGIEIRGKLFGLLLGLLMAVSTSQIGQSTNLTSPSMVGVFALLTIYFFIKYIKSGGNKYAFWMAFMAATSINIHFQAIGLLLLIPIAFIFDAKKKNKKIFIMLLGIIIPFIPLIIFDLSNNFFESRNMLQYYFHDQYKISFDVLNRRWLTYAGVFWPKAWANIIGGYPVIGYIEIACLSLVVLYSLFKRAVLKEWNILGISFISFLSMFILMRYARTPLFDSYLVSLHVFVIMLTGWAIFLIYKKNIFLGLIVLITVVFGSIYKDIGQIRESTNYASLRAQGWSNLLINTYQNQKFSIYDHGYRSTNSSFPLVLFLNEEGKISDAGYKIGFGSKPHVEIQDHKEIKGNRVGFTLRDLNSSSSAQLRDDGWAFINPSQIYKSTVEWYIKDKK